MAGISSKVSLIDGVTSVWNNIVSATQQGVNAFENASAGAEAVDTAISSAGASMGDAAASMSYAGDVASNSSKSLDELVSAAEKMDQRTATAFERAGASARKLELELEALDKRRDAIANAKRAELEIGIKWDSVALDAAVEKALEVDKEYTRLSRRMDNLQVKWEVQSEVVSDAAQAHEQAKQSVTQLSQAQQQAAQAAEEENNAVKNATQSIDDQDRSARNASNGGLDMLLKKVLSIATAYKILRKASEFISSSLDTGAYTAQLQALMGDNVGKQAAGWAKQTARAYGRAYEDVLQSTLSLTKMGAGGADISALSNLSNRLALFTKDNDYSAMSEAIQNAFKTGRTSSLASALNMAQSTLAAYGVDKAIEAADIDAYVVALNAAANAAGMTEEAANKIFNDPKAQAESFLSNITNMFSTAADSFWTYFAPALQNLNQWFQTEQAMQFFALLSGGFALAGEIASVFMNALMTVGNWIGNNWQAIMLIATIAVGVFAVKMLLAAASTALANAPLLIMIAVVVALAKAAIKAGATVEQIAEVIGGVIGTLAAFLYNRFVDVWNFIAIFINFLANAFNDPVTAIKVLFLELAEWIVKVLGDALSFVETLINKIPGVEVDITSGVNRVRDDLAAKAQKAKDESEWIEYVQQKSYMDYEDAYSAGASKATSIVNDVTDAVNGLSDLTIGNGLDWGGSGVLDTTDDYLASIDKNTKKNDSSDEELRYLRMIAERQALDRETNVYVTVDNSGMINNVGSAPDIDGYFSEFVENLSEQVVISVEGVYAT